MKLRDVIKALHSLHRFDLITFHDFGMAPIGYNIDDLMKYVDNDEEPVMDAFVDYFETRNNCVELYGDFREYLKEIN